MVLHKYGDRLYQGLIRTLTTHLQVISAKIEATQGVPFLKDMKKRWDEHNKSTQMIRDILMVRTHPPSHQPTHSSTHPRTTGGVPAPAPHGIQVDISLASASGFKGAP